MNRRSALALAALAAMSASPAVRAQATFPEKPVTLEIALARELGLLAVARSHI